VPFVAVWRVQLLTLNVASLATTAILIIEKVAVVVTETAVSSDGERIAAD